MQQNEFQSYMLDEMQKGIKINLRYANEDIKYKYKKTLHEYSYIEQKFESLPKKDDGFEKEYNILTSESAKKIFISKKLGEFKDKKLILELKLSDYCEYLADHPFNKHSARPDDFVAEYAFNEANELKKANKHEYNKVQKEFNEAKKTLEDLKIDLEGLTNIEMNLKPINAKAWFFCRILESITDMNGLHYELSKGRFSEVNRDLTSTTTTSITPSLENMATTSISSTLTSIPKSTKSEISTI